MQKVLVTGAAGFIGYHLSKRLASEGFSVIGIDSLNNYYDVNLKLERVRLLSGIENFRFLAINICDKPALDELFESHQFDFVVNLAAQAGVRYSIEQPYKYADSNLIGFLNILEACRRFPVKHLVYASSSSVYGLNSTIPFKVGDTTDKPASLYAATKKANELMAFSYAHTYRIPSTGMRFFTVYGPYGRPDMAYYSFTHKIMKGEPIPVFNEGNMKRDFTYIDDAIMAVRLVLPLPPEASGDNDGTMHRIVNVGHNEPVLLMDFIRLLESYTGRKAKLEMKPMQLGDVPVTYANTDRLKALTGYSPDTDIEAGLKSFVNWYLTYYHN